MVEIREINSVGDLKKFVDFHIEMYRDNPHAVPDLRMDELNNLRKDKNPAFEYCEARYFLAYKDGKIAGRIAGLINHAANEKWNKKDMRFCRVDFIDDQEVSEALFGAVEAWAKERGLQRVVGPIGFCDLDKEGMLIEGFEEQDLFITIYNAPYYQRHLEKLGYGKEVDWIEFRIKIPDFVEERIQKLSERIMQRNKLKLLDITKTSQIRPYAHQLFELINEAYGDLYGTTTLTEKQMNWYAGQFLTLLNPNLVKVIVDEQGKAVGMGVAAPSLGEALKKSNGRLFPFGFLYILRAIKKPEVMNLFFIAVSKKYLNQGLPAILMQAMTVTANKLGIEYAETGPELETNEKVRAVWKPYEARQHRRRRCFEKEF